MEYTAYHDRISALICEFKKKFSEIKKNKIMDYDLFVKMMEELAIIDLQFIDFKKCTKVIKGDVFIGNYIIKINKYKLLVNSYIILIRRFNSYTKLNFTPVITSKNYILKINDFCASIKNSVTDLFEPIKGEKEIKTEKEHEQFEKKTEKESELTSAKTPKKKKKIINKSSPARKETIIQLGQPNEFNSNVISSPSPLPPSSSPSLFEEIMIINYHSNSEQEQLIKKKKCLTCAIL